MYRDEHGLIVQRNMDGGDTCQRTGMYYFGLAITGVPLVQEFRANVRQLERLGILFRHPYQPQHNSAMKVSRDQSDPVIVALGVYGERNMLSRVWQCFKARMLRYQNGDVPQLQSISLWIRAWRVRWLWPVLLFTDCGFLLNLLFAWVRERNPDHSDDNNHIIRLCQAIYTMPTPVSWLARKLYSKLRMKCYGYVGMENQAYPDSYRYNEPNRIMATLTWYHRAENDGNPEIAEVFRPIINRYFR